MKLSTKNLLIVLVVLVVIYAITQWTKGTGKSSSMRSDLVQIDTAEVTQVVITSLGEQVVLNKSDGDWNVEVGVGTRPTRDGSVSALINTLNGIQPSRLAAKKEENWKDYQVDSTGTDVKVYNEDELLAHLVVGRMGFENQRSYYSFVRLGEDTNVYAASDFMSGSVAKTTAGFRDNMLFRLNKDSLVSVQFQYPDSAFSLVKNGKWFLENQEADSTSMEQFLNGLSIVSSRNFYDDDLPAVPSHQVTFNYSNGRQVTLEAFRVQDGFVVRSSENTAEAWKDGSLDKKVLKSQQEFIGN